MANPSNAAAETHSARAELGTTLHVLRPLTRTCRPQHAKPREAPLQRWHAKHNISACHSFHRLHGPMSIGHCLLMSQARRLQHGKQDRDNTQCKRQIAATLIDRHAGCAGHDMVITNACGLPIMANTCLIKPHAVQKHTTVATRGSGLTVLIWHACVQKLCQLIRAELATKTCHDDR